MDHTKCQDISVTAARALHIDASEQEGRCSLTIDSIDVLVDLGEEADALHCYVDLGDANLHDRLEVCKQLFALNLRTHAHHHGTYAFEPGSARVIFCANVLDDANLKGEECIGILQCYVAGTEKSVGGITTKGLSTVFTGTLA